ncbi:DUF4347 domain-containing protein [Nitrosomonas sp. Nm58]|uniref:DUF4347 domain-containing protein n=1 Tax=Nitrosomonas sp. Nm58 TaxID=200126 RepID=UPI00089C9526|nr:DUF4347 domain-containing protein [Nitrosomonas sp. Nm58]SDY28051.1 protein of unknown function [Nitrosomonas sp. Nm58]
MANTKLSLTAHAEHTSEVTIISSSKIALETTQALASKSPENGFSLTAPPLPFKNDNISLSTERKEIVFIDQGVEDYPSLIAGTKAGMEIHVINSAEDGVLQITGILKQQSAISAVHIVSHGNVGYLALGDSVLSAETLNHYQDALFSWRRALNDDADILVYGCEVGKGAAGYSFIEKLTEITSANIAASHNLTGHLNKNADWNLGVRIGHIRSSIPFNDKIISAYQGTLATEVEDFNTDPSVNLTPSFTLNGFTYTFTADGDGGDFIWESNLGVDSTGGIKPDSGAGAGPNLVTTERYTIAKSDGTAFVFNSVQLWSGSQSVTVTGKLSNSTVGTTTLTADNTAFQNAAFTGGATVVDIIEISSLDFDISKSDMLDNFSYDLTVPTSSPFISSATYNANTGVFVVTGADIQANSSGADIDASKLTFTGEGGATYTLTDSADVERDSATQFTITLSATDKAAINQTINKNGTSSTSGTSYNLAAADDWNTNVTDGDTADATGNGITVSNVAVPTITSATYDADTGALVVTGTGFLSRSGATNDIVASKFTFTGEGGETHTLTDTANVEITSGTAFIITLSATDKAAINLILNKNGNLSTDISTYMLSAAEDWAAGADAAVDVEDTFNNITVSNVAIPTITSATYDASTGALVVTGTGFLSRSGATNDIDVSKFTFTGEGGATYTLTTANVETTSGTSFAVTLNATDQAAINQIINKNGTSSTSGTAYNLAAAEDWAAGADAAITVADLMGNGITVSNVAVPTITSATYDASTGALVVTGTNFLKASDAANDIDVSKFTFTGEGGATYTLTTANVEITSGTSFAVTLNATDQAAINQIINKNGMSSTSGTAYNLAAAEDWAAGADAAVTVADLTGNGITVSNVAVPTITSATYDASTGALVVTGTNFLKASGAANDIDVSKFIFTGEGGATYTLTTANVEIASGTSFAVTLNATDQAAINQIINKNGMSSTSGTTYNLAAAEDWAAGADATVTVADLTDNGITVSNVAAPSSGSSGTPTLIDGVIVTTTIRPDGAALLTTPVVDITRQDDPTTLFRDHADIPVVSNSQDDPILTVSIPAGVGLSAEGRPQVLNKQDAASDLIQRIEQKTTAGSESRQTLTSHGQNFLDSLAPGESASVHTLELFVSDHQKPGAPIIITGPDAPTESKQILIIDASNLPADTVLHMNNVAFAVIIGSVRVVGGNGKNFVTADVQDQVVILGADDDILFGGGGNDTVGSLGGDDQVSGDAGNDIVYGGSANDTLNGGSGNDRLNGGLGFDSAIQEGQLTDFQVEIHGHEVVLTHRNGAVDTLTDVELVHFTSGPSLAIVHSATEAAAHHLVKTWLGRDLTVAEGNAVQNWRDADVDDIVAAFLDLPEAMGLRDKTGNELLAGLENNPNILQLNVAREFIGTTANNDQGYLPLGLALNADGGMGHDVLRMPGSRHDVHLEFVGDTLELTRLSDGAMLGLKNAEAIAFDNGETVILAHNSTEAILARLFHSFFNRDATAAEWQLGREALAAQVSPDIILDWFQQKAGLGDLSNTDYLQAIFTQTLGRQATETELNEQLPRLEKGQINREWLAVEIAGSTEAINLVGNVILHEGWI